MDERLRFVARLLEGEKMAELCREFDISRKTGYKIFQRYKDLGLDGLTDRSRRPFRQANKLPMQIETLIVQLKREHPSSGDQHRARRARCMPPRPLLAFAYCCLGWPEPSVASTVAEFSESAICLRREVEVALGQAFDLVRPDLHLALAPRDARKSG